MKNLPLFFLLAAITGFSCNSTLHGLLKKNTPHEEYSEKLDDTGLKNTMEGRLWLAASEKAIANAQEIELPYKHQGYFHPDKPRALGLQFTARFGERIIITLDKKQGRTFVVYADLFKQTGNAPTHLIAADTTQNQFNFDVNETGTYILRLQPELYRSGEYILSVSVGASLGFPVSGSKANVGSIWGDSRDGGKRRHEGIDIFAPKRTPVVAIADGYVTGVRNGGIGGKTVWMRPNDKNIFLYYAHLDKQLVKEGQAVKKGDVLGLVGNTGNARHTPSHLHFGVYTAGGPIDPLPFVNKTVKTAPDVADKSLTGYLQLTQNQKTTSGNTIKAKTMLVPLAVSSKGYIGELPDGTLLQTPFASVKTVKEQPKQSIKMATTTGNSSVGS